ncbi:hypothetical protein QJ854_gp425 [Moumouvirus goulette]|uniref:Uncharacterized protein n=1 Tax=Moumouvirus goulette TaxID=1247379 RepID=M1PX76_9VIRU|nr:hypothetical protein QJ854_gp425 [Moumouvirus goulette]AGF85357.1 hypothetical protein glt_00548 [Moumouvirus goulette]
MSDPYFVNSFANFMYASQVYSQPQIHVSTGPQSYHSRDARMLIPAYQSQLIYKDDGFISQYYLGKKKNAKVDPRPCGPNHITYPDWKEKRGYQ